MSLMGETFEQTKPAAGLPVMDWVYKVPMAVFTLLTF